VRPERLGKLKNISFHSSALSIPKSTGGMLHPWLNAAIYQLPKEAAEIFILERRLPLITAEKSVEKQITLLCSVHKDMILLLWV
jgi:hypothetical protein